ncbi:putative mRNA processing [Lyophyllum shimeji]|uniref:mRNA processing n=1 Tax=Lyophyllum shimeji TaxID=47721 RepID=A0A9P3UK86_LYOSH|nr:putative mRNA processing [Lyophyllum shimeji]
MAEAPAAPEIFDSLPYYDDDLQKFPDLKQKVDRELAREPKPPSELHPRVPPPFELFANDPLLRAELERVEAHQPFPSLDTLRYQLPAPISTPGTDEEWQEALKNARAQLEHQKIRQTNLTLLQNYGANAWRIHNYLAEATAKQTEKALEDLKQLTVEVNRARKNEQDRLGKQLTMLETRWTELISNVLQIEMANVALDAEIEQLNKREADLAQIDRHEEAECCRVHGQSKCSRPAPVTYLAIGRCLAARKVATPVRLQEDEKLRQASLDASMANTDKEPTVSPQLSGKEGNGPAVELLSGGGEGSRVEKSADDAARSIVAGDAERSTPSVSSDAKPSPSTTRPSLVQLGSGSQTPTTAQPKRFSAVNINKKFLEKNSSASASSPISQPASKAGSPALRPQAQTSTSHSRLVTTKLTSISPASSASGAGWSRPSSAAPPVAAGSHSPNNASPPLPSSSLGTPSATAGAPQLPHAGKVIQPQPRSAAAQSALSSKDGPGAGTTRPAWGNIKSTVPPKRADVQNDFPTAAEVAQVASSLRTAKANDARGAAESAAASKQARMEEADTFRGVHLDPNAHHWDEMEEDDDNFLDGVIEFGDGRQYKIETTDEPSADSSLTMDTASSAEPHLMSKSRLDDITSLKGTGSDLPVSKEERFADDFDRSWPRSRTSPATPRDVPLPSGHPGPHPAPTSPALSQDMHSQQESSRVLFNERSNRLEPYNHTHRTGAGQYMSKSRTWQESSTSPTEPRNTRDFSSSSQSQAHNIQLLQKSGGTEPSSRLRRFSGTSASGSVSSLAVAHAMRGPSRDTGRQLPPHLAISPTAPVAPGRRTSRDSRFGPPTPGESSVPNSARLPSQSPALSHASAARISPGVPVTPLPQPGPDLDEVRKDVMQSAAARAKLRRQQEEEEREKEKERARRKAAELEERMKAAEAEKAKAREQQSEAERLAKRQQEEEAIAVIEEAVKSVQLPNDADAGLPAKLAIEEPAPSKVLPTVDSTKPAAPERLSTSVSATRPSAASPPSSAAAQAESWRRKAGPLPPATPNPKPTVPSFVPPQPVLNLVDGPEEDLEVVDFSDMGRFVGAPDAAESAKVEAEPVSAVRPSSSRPVASDFLDEPPHTEAQSASTAGEGRWKSKSLQDARSQAAAATHKEVVSKPSPAKDQPRNEVAADAPRTSDIAPAPPATTTLPSTEHHTQTVNIPPQPTTVRTPRNQMFYKEAAMSALDDAMSRIKGALDGMQAGETSKEVPLSVPDSEPLTGKNGHTAPGKASTQKERWIPPALRPRNFDPELQEVFHVTCSEPPLSPKPAWNAFVVKIPPASRPLEPIHKRQLQWATKPSYQVRLDILTFDPPVEGMNRRDLSVNDVLFRKPIGGFRGKPRYIVKLPRFRSGPRVHLPAHPLPPKANGVGAFGRPSGADGVSTWRKPAQSKPESGEGTDTEAGLTTTSRSPPPDTLGTTTGATSIPVSDSSASTKPVDAATPVKSRVPKMPAGSAVAFYRDSRIDAVEEDPKPSVNFIVGSELESRQPSQATTPSKPQPNTAVTSPVAPTSSPDSLRATNAPLVNGVKESLTTETPSLVPSKPESKSSDDSTDRVPVTPPTHHTTPWARSSLTIPLKESPARGPDPEHLKAVWSQTSNKPGSHGVNSLEGIADDLTALPFTLQEVKSEDGETPPPLVSAAPSRMSLHDVTRAFQQVPSSSSSNPSPSHRTPPLAARPASRPSNYAYGYAPPPASAVRPSYPYPSPIMSHSPSPGLVYPPLLPPGSPVPGRMPVNGHAPLYSQPMWMPLPAGSTPQNQPSMMRPMASPYPAQLMAYSHSAPPMYGHQPTANMQNPPQQQNGLQSNRDRNLSMMSPVMPHAGTAMYPSPVLMHAPVMSVPGSHGYMMPAGRGQARADNGQIPIQQNTQQANHPPHSGYNPVPTSPFVRPTW